MTAVLQLLGALREAGALGGIVFDAAGKVVAHTMPSFFPDASLDAAGERIVILYETMTDNFEPVTEITLAFTGHSMLVRRSSELYLAVVVNDAANREAVKMATNLVFRRLGARTATPIDPQPRPPPAAARPPPVPPPQAPRAARPAPPPAPLPKKKKTDIWGD